MTYVVRWLLFVALAFISMSILTMRARASCDTCIYLPALTKAESTLIPTTPPTSTQTPTSTPIPTATALAYICDHDAYNCPDFSTHAAAQAVFEYCQALGFGDIHRLDRDNDWDACEDLP